MGTRAPRIDKKLVCMGPQPGLAGPKLAFEAEKMAQLALPLLALASAAAATETGQPLKPHVRCCATARCRSQSPARVAAPAE